MTRRYFQRGDGVAIDMPVLVATITALFALVVGGRSPRKAHGQRKALTVATTTKREPTARFIVQNVLIASAALIVITLMPARLNGEQSPRELFERALIIEEANQDHAGDSAL